MTKKCHGSNLAINLHEHNGINTRGRNPDRIGRLLPGFPVISEPRQRLDLVNSVVNL